MNCRPGFLNRALFVRATVMRFIAGSRMLYVIAGEFQSSLISEEDFDPSGCLSAAFHSFRSVDEFLCSYERLRIRCECLVLMLPAQADLSPLVHLRRQAARLPVIVVSDDHEISTAVLAMRHGATDFLARPVAPEELLRRIRDVFAAATPKSLRIDDPESVPGLSSLTRCERQVLHCVLSAMTTKQISGAMHVGLQTIAKHKQRVLKKLGARNDVELVLQMVRADPPSQTLAAAAS